MCKPKSGKICGEDDCNDCHGKSFAKHPRSKFLISDVYDNQINANHIPISSSKFFKFKCDQCNHVFSAKIAAITRTGGGTWCPYCGKKILCDKCDICYGRSFASHPKSKYWSHKNQVSPREIFLRSDKEYLFDCEDCGHEFCGIISVITSQKPSWCPYCNGNKLCDSQDCEKCYNKSFASNEKSKYWSSNNKITPRQVCNKSSGKYFFCCPDCDHEFDSNLNNISSGNWCPYCNNKRLCDRNDCELCYHNSFASNAKSKYLDDGVNPRKIFKNSNAIYQFKCDKCPRRFGLKLNKVSLDGKWCPCCLGNIICKDACCVPCLNKSFASHEKSKYWSSKNGENIPRYISLHSHDKYWFDCHKCLHKFEAPLNRVAAKNNPSWCPYCENQRRCSDNQDMHCYYCYQNSFASHWRAEYWSPKNKSSPSEVSYTNGKKYYFICDKCDREFYSTIANITNPKKPTWCPHCQNKTEAKFGDFLELKQIPYERQAKFEWCKNPETRRLLPFDFYLPDHNIIIEIDGEQHYKQVANWTPPEQTQKRDRYKEQCAKDNGVQVLRLKQEDVWYDRNDWQLIVLNILNTK